jgi:SPP1 gp7 family putative phage head morphogenesis protein
MIEGALKADGRLAAKNAVKIRAALHQVTDFKRVFNKYQETMPQPTDNPTQDRVRARSWVLLNVYLNDEPLRNAVMQAWAEAYVLGAVAASEWLEKTRIANKADDIEINWDKWRPGDTATALRITPTEGFSKYLRTVNADSYFKNFNKETVENLGTALSNAITLGLDAESAAVMIGKHVANPSRALTIAITEQNRAMSFSTIQRYQAAGLQKMEWAVSDPCDICAKNDGQIIQIGQTFASGDAQPPAHPHCRCVLLPVIPGMEDNPAGIDGTVTTPTTGADGAISTEPLVPTVTSSTEWQPVDEAGWIERQTRYRISRNLPPPNLFQTSIIRDQFNDASIILEKGNVTVLLDKKLKTVTDEMLDAFLTNFDEVYEKLPAWRKLNPDGTIKDFLLLIKEGVEGTKGNVNAYTYLGHDTIWFSAQTVRNAVSAPRILTEPGADIARYRLPNGNKTRWSMPVAYEVNENKYTIAHELGHDVDSNSNNPMRGRFVGGLRRKYKDGDLWSAYGTENAKEAYAEVFAQWLLGEQTPVTQAFAERFGWNLGLQEYWDLMPDYLKWKPSMRQTGQG